MVNDKSVIALLRVEKNYYHIRKIEIIMCLKTCTGTKLLDHLLRHSNLPCLLFSDSEMQKKNF